MRGSILLFVFTGFGTFSRKMQSNFQQNPEDAPRQPKAPQRAPKGTQREPKGRPKGAEMAATWCQKGDLECLWKPMGSHAVSDPLNRSAWSPFPGFILGAKTNKTRFQKSIENVAREEEENKCQGRQKGTPMEPKQSTKLEKTHVRN